MNRNSLKTAFKPLSLLFAVACTINLNAQESDILEKIALDMAQYGKVATITKQNEHYQPYIISVFQGKELQKLGVSNLKEALELVPGVDMATDNVNYKTPIFRGSNPFAYGQSKLLIDGVLVNDLFLDGYSAYLDMPIDIIKRIEVVRGPGSKTDGVNAYAGSINVITYAEQLEGFETEDRLFLKGGSYDYRMGGFVKTYKQDGFTLFTDFFYLEDNKKLPAGPDAASLGIYNYPHLGIDNTPLSQSGDAPLWLKNYALGLHLSYKAFSLRARTLYHKQGSAYGINALLPKDDDHVKLPSHSLELAYDKEFGHYKAIIKAGVKLDAFQSQSKLTPDGFELPSLSDPIGTKTTYTNGFYGEHEAAQRTLYQSSYLKYSGFENHYLSFGYRLSKEETRKVVTKTTDRDSGTGLTDYGQTYPFFDKDAQRDILALSFQDKFDYSSSLSLMYGINVEKISHQNAQFDPRLSMVYRMDRENIFKAIYSRSHRNPSWQEMYTINNRARVGNPDLDPETVRAFEAAYIRNFSNDSYLQANIFYLNNKDQIDKTNPQNEFRNSKDTDIYGLELEFKGNITQDNQIYANYAFVDGEDDKGNPLANVAQHMAKGYYIYNYDPYFSISTLAKYVGAKERVMGDDREKLKAYTTVDASLQYQSRVHDFTLTLSVKNIFDEEVKYPSEPYTYTNDYPQEGRNFLIAFKKSFR